MTVTTPKPRILVVPQVACPRYGAAFIVFSQSPNRSSSLWVNFWQLTAERRVRCHSWRKGFTTRSGRISHGEKRKTTRFLAGLAQGHLHHPHLQPDHALSLIH